ncbi:MAG TPA: alpha-1,4-glucan--maltose-1-phosphate maltosyltransferase [Acidobacteriaceae bacterium]|nr:alpha-1,4-glucan--maltose-1-phosphate maltosyltransferase [Acidobacteriaceae bacterium]
MTTDTKLVRTRSIAAKLEGRSRVVIEAVRPEIDGGEYPIQRVVGESVQVEGDIFADGHDVVAAHLLYRGPGDRNWRIAPMELLTNDRWRGEFCVSELGPYRYTLEGWIDPFATWRTAMRKRIDAGQDVHVELTSGRILVAAAALRARGADGKRLKEFAARLESTADQEAASAAALDPTLRDLMRTYSEHAYSTRYAKELIVQVGRTRANFSAWYEIFPRSCAAVPGQHGTFKDCEAWLPYIASMNFDVLYFPPIHPIGDAFRKGKNNAEKAEPEDVGSPWAIGSSQGGHTAIHPRLGTLNDFKALIVKAKEHGLEIALDIAFQCSPDHPWVTEHPSFFRKRPDGTIQYAENPPKKYQDIYPLDFETEDWRELWSQLKGVIDHWIDQGVLIFRVDNPHTKSFPFWKWVIGEVKAAHPEVIFLAEAFTRPKVMYRLAKLGFTQSYTYFTWRNTKEELTEYMTELTKTEVVDFFRPNFWPNTPDILPVPLQQGGRPAFLSRLVLAATLSSNYGIYGPAFELCENTALRAGAEDYLNSEKYQLRQWDVEEPQNLQTLIARVNQIRRAHPAMHSNRALQFHPTDQLFLLCYSKVTSDKKDVILAVVNLDPRSVQAGWAQLDLEALGISENEPVDAHDLLTDAHYTWNGSRVYIELEAGRSHIFQLTQKHPS